jgi:aminopeptidase-like protein
MKALLVRLWPLHRTLVSDGTDIALELIGEALPVGCSYEIETYAPGSSAWTWRVPERYEVDEAYLELEDGSRRIADFSVNPLHLVSYSPPVDLVLSWDELEPHIHSSKERPDAIPWEFKYYERDWGFCIPQTVKDGLPRDARYRAVIKSRFNADPAEGLRVGVARIAPEGGGGADEMVICAHVCHVRQANDDLSGVVTAVELARRLAQRPLPADALAIRILFVPETIGSVCWFSRHEERIPNIKAGIFLEMTGNRNTLKLQRSRQDDHLIDRIARYILKRRGMAFEEGRFREVKSNDEMVINGPGVNIPCISLSRWPYPEYHTSDDDPSIIDEHMLAEAADVAEEIVRICATDYVPRRTFHGPLFLSGYGLWVDWRQNRPLNQATEKIMLRLDGDRTLFEIAEEVGLSFEEVRSYVERFRAKNLVEALPIPSEPSDFA